MLLFCDIVLIFHYRHDNINEMILQFFFIKEREVFGKNSTELVKEHDVKKVVIRNRFYQLH